MLTNRAYTFRIHPSPEQETVLFRQLTVSRWCWNYLVNAHRDHYEEHKESLNKTALTKIAQDWRNEPDHPERKELPSRTMSAVINKLDIAYKAFYRRLREGKPPQEAGEPRFKGRPHWQSIPLANQFVYVIHDDNGANGTRRTFLKLGGDLLIPLTNRGRIYGWRDGLRSYAELWVRSDHEGTLIKVNDDGEVYANGLPGEIKSATLKHQAKGWYITLFCEVEIPDPPTDRTFKAVGIDPGLKYLLAIYDTNESFGTVDNPHWFVSEQQKLRRLQRSAQRKAEARIPNSVQAGLITQEEADRYQAWYQKGWNHLTGPEREAYRDIRDRMLPQSNKEKEARRLVARQQERIANRRKTFYQQLVSQLVDEYTVICVEDASPQFMLKNKHLSKAAVDAAWSEFKTLLEYKAAERGSQVIMVPAHNTTQACSECGEIVIKELSDRWHACPHCGYEADRDVNAARVILKRGLEQLKAE